MKLKGENSASQSSFKGEGCSSAKIMGIFGTGRSGSSWLGSIVSSHPEVAYRFEPFHRLKHLPAVAQAQQLLESAELTEQDLASVYQVLLPAHPRVERPPFFPKSYGMSWGKTELRPLALRFEILQSVFQKIYSVKKVYPPLVFKEVTMESMMSNVLEKTSMKVVYLVRHPCAVVASTLKGQKEGVMPVGRHAILDKLLRKYEPDLAERVIPQLSQLDALDKETLLWRIDVNKGMAAVQQYPHILLVVYEELCDQPMQVSQRVFQHLGLDFSAQTEAFLTQLTQPELSKSKRWREIGIGNYFSVFKNPALVKNKWKDTLPKESQAKIVNWVKDSTAFTHCARIGNWE